MLDRPAAPAVLALLAALVFVSARLAFAAHGDVARFIVVGSANLSGHGLPRGIPVIPGTGYDGQFYYRQALSPFDTSLVAHGIRLDGYYRLQRLGYPLIAYVAAAGRGGLVPVSLVAVNVVGMGFIGLCGGLLAARAGRHACCGLLLPGYFGFVTTLARDLTEIVEVSLLLGGVLAFRGRRYLLAGLSFAGAVVTKESEVVVVTAYALVFLAAAPWRRLRRPLRASVAFLLPFAAFGAVQLWLKTATGQLALRSGTTGNLATPLVAPFHAVAHYLSHPTTLANAVWLGELAVLTFMVLAAVASAWRTSAPTEEKVAFVLLIALALSLSGEVWNGQADFRSLAPLYAVAAVLLLAARRRLGLLLAVTCIAVLVTFVHRVAFI
jgi:hypothetical protein